MADDYVSETFSDGQTSYEKQNHRLNSTSSFLSLSTIKSDESKVQQRYTRKVNSAYIPKKTLSRYKNSATLMLPFRRTKSRNNLLPLDSIGCFSNTVFSWIRPYRITRSFLKKYKELPTHEILNENKFLIPQLPKRDSCEDNGKRFLGLYKDEVCLHGTIKSSMFKVARKFCSTRIVVSSIIHTLAVIIGLGGLIVFIQLYMRSLLMNNSNNESSESKFNDQQFKRIGWSISIVSCFFLYIFLNNITNWINLRTALRLRIACLSSVYNNAMKSSVTYRIAPHQILSLVYEETEIIFLLVQKGSLIFGLIIGLVTCMIGLFFLLSFSILVPFITITPLIIISYAASKISTIYSRKSVLYASKKLTAIEDFCINFKNIIILNQENQIKYHFNIYLEKQFSCLRWSEIYSTRYSGYITSIMLVGTLYLSKEIGKDDVFTLTAFLIYACLIKALMANTFNAINSIYEGKEYLEKLKNIISSVYDPLLQTRLRLGKYPMISIANGNFKWKKTQHKNEDTFTLHVADFSVSKSQIIGVTGPSLSGKTTFLYSIIGSTLRMENKNALKQNCEVAFFSQTPFLITGSLKDNIIMKSKFDLTRYQNAITTTNLDEDVCIKSDDDELPIGTLELDFWQKERVILARALYCDKELILLDDPFNNSTQSNFTEIFKNVLQQLLASGKSVILTTQNVEYLSNCHKIYFIYNGFMGERFENYQQIPEHYKNLLNPALYRHSLIEENVVKGCNRFSISSMKNYKLTKNSYGNDNSTEYAGNSEDPFISNNGQSFEFISFIKGASLLSLYLLITLGYLCLMILFIDSIQRKESDVWFAYSSLGGIILMFLIELLTKCIVACIARTKCISYQKKMFKNLKATSLTFLHSKSLSDIMHHFSVNIFYEFLVHAKILQSSAHILVTTVILIYYNYWVSIILTIIMLSCFIFYRYLYFSVLHLSTCELNSRRKMFTLISNNMLGRAIIQSFDKIIEFSKSFYGLVEENSTSIFIHKSIIYHGQFILKVVLGVGLFSILLMCGLMYREKDEEDIFPISLFLYFEFCLSVNNLMTGLLEQVKSKSMASVVQFIDHIPTCDHFKEKKILDDTHKGLSVNFRDIKCNFSGKNFMKIEKLIVQNGEKIAIVGRGSSLIVPLLYRLIKPVSGQIMFGDEDILNFCPDFFKTILGVVPVNPKTCNGTIRTILNPSNDCTTKQMETALNIIGLLEKISNLPEKWNEPISNLSHEDCQLICLAKCYILQPPIILIEKPHYSIQHIIDDCIRKYFCETTIIFIGASNESFDICDRIFRLD